MDNNGIRLWKRWKQYYEGEASRKYVVEPQK